jgi:hypothetical protein
MHLLKNQKYLYFFIIVSFQTLIAQKLYNRVKYINGRLNQSGYVYDQLGFEAIRQGKPIKVALQQDIAMITARIEGFSRYPYTPQSLKELAQKTVDSFSLMLALFYIIEQIEPESHAFNGLIHNFLYQPTQKSREQLQLLRDESYDLFHKISDGGSKVNHSEGSPSNAEATLDILERYQKWLTDTKAAYEFKLQDIIMLSRH